MAVMVARVGRHRQRYEDNLRLVSGCIPYRLKKDDIFDGSSLENKVEVLMIASPNRNDLVFPKGGWDNDETVKEAACREALEEAGVRGVLSDTPLGVWEFRSKSSQAICSSLEGGCRGYMFALEVTEELEAWPEQENHHRRWLKVKDAFELCRYEWMRMALAKFLKKLGDEVKLEVIGETAKQTSSSTLTEVIADCQIIASNYCLKPPNAQHSVLLSFSWIVADGLSLT